MKKKALNLLGMIFVVLICCFVAINNVDAQTLKVKNNPTYRAYGLGAHKWIMSNGKKAYCLNLDKNGPPKGAKMSCSTSKDGGLLYLLEVSTGKTGDNDTAIRQAAIWKYLNNKYVGNNTLRSKAKSLANAAAKHKNYTHNPEVTIGKLTPKLVAGENYYETNLIKPGTKNITSGKYSVSVSGVSGSKILNANNEVVSSLKTSEKFKVRVPVNKLTAKKTVTVTINAKGTKVTALRCKYSSSGYQDLGLALTNKSAPATAAKTKFTVQPVKITIKKVDQDNTKTTLSGAKYKIFANSTCTEEVPGYTDTYTTGSDGTVSVFGLAQGTYYVKETAAPKGYATVSETNCLSVSTGGTVTFKNSKNFVEVSKQDREGRELKGAVFALYNNKTCTDRTKDATTGKKLAAKTTDEHGKVTFKGMDTTNPSDKSNYYYLKEITPPTGYFEVDECRAVRINGAPAEFVNTKISNDKIVIQKRDGYTDYGMSNIKIGLFSDSACSTQISTATTSGSGQIIFDIIYGEGSNPTYYVKELEVPAGYVPKTGKDNVECKSVTAGTDNNSTVIYNIPYGNIKILKVENGTDKPISGVTFALLDENKKEVTDIDGNKVANQTTDSEGNLEFKNVVYGTYYLQEVSTGGKYKLIGEPIKFILNDNTDSVKLATRGTVEYKYGDVNGDSIIDEDDLAIYQAIIANPDEALGLAPEASYAMDIDRNGNLTVNDLKEDMKTLQYYLKFYNSSDSSTVNAAKNYISSVNSFCTLVGSDNCSVNNLDIILDMYNSNKEEFANYATDYAQWQTAHAQWQTNYDAWEQQIIEYNDHCSTPADDASPEDGTLDSDEQPTSNDYDCSQTLPDAPEEPLLSTVCSQYSMVGDLNGDCSVDNVDVNILSNAINGSGEADDGDLNNDGFVNHTDLDILTRYVYYKGKDNSTAVFSNVKTIVDNKALICDGSSSECDIDISSLTDSITNVGRSGTLPASIARASISITNELITMKISKFQVSKSKEIPGAKIVIRDSKNNKILEYTSTKSPKEFNVPAGKYTLTEKVAPKGYKTLTTTISFEVGEDGSVKLTGAKSNLYTIKKDTNNHLIIYNELIKPQNVKVPNTGSNIAILSIVTGIVLVAGGGYFIYKRII